MPFIQQNLDIILGLSAIVVLLVLYIVIKKRKTEKKSQIIEDYSDIEVVDDIYAKEQQERDEKKLDKIIEELKSPSTSIKQQTTSVEKEETLSTPTNHNPHKHIKTVDVPHHDKIVKDDFKDFAGLKMLVAEDNLINQKVIAGMLNESGIDITFAGDGLETISFLNNQKDFDIVLMDAHMPNMDGFEATRKIRSHPEFDDIAIVALSGDVAADDIKKMYDAGMDAHLEKPLKMDALYDILYAFTKNKAPKEDGKKQPALDTKTGIEISGSDEAFYKEILKEFLDDYSDAKERVGSMLEQSEFKNADALLLDLTGITANIGAEPAHTAILELRKALKEGTIQEYKEAYTKFADAFDALLDEIRSYLV